jgi:hypothetical protein
MHIPVLCFSYTVFKKGFTMVFQMLGVLSKSVEQWVVYTPLSVNVFVTLATRQHLESSICSLLSINVTKSFTLLLFVITTCFSLIRPSSGVIVTEAGILSCHFSQYAINIWNAIVKLFLNTPVYS